jgi:hypothetical protein
MHVADFMDSLGYAAYGLGGIFVIIALLALITALLRVIFPANK